MADRCDAFRTNLAEQTPVYDEIFLQDYKPIDSPVMGRHESGVWPVGTGDTHTFDRVTVGQPDLQSQWQRVTATGCADPCDVPRTFVGMGTLRDTYFPEQKDLQSQTFCLTQLEHSTRPQDQIAEWMKKIKKLPEIYVSDFLRVHATDRADAIQICGDDFATLTPDTGVGGNISGMLTTIDLTASGLPTSQLTFPYLNYLTTDLDLQGYHEADSGLGADLFNLITDKRSWFNLTNGAPELKNMMALRNPQEASALYKIGSGIQQPYGNIAPTLDTRQIRFQAQGNVLYRVEPYINQASTTGIRPVVNTAYLQARYALSFLWHPKAIKLWTKAFTKLNEMVPSVSNALYGKWSLINDPVLMAEQPDGTVCTLRNDKRLYFYWLCAMYLGFQYKYPELLMPIIHLIDGSGRSCTTDLPVCGDAPQYVAQDYTNNPTVCET